MNTIESKILAIENALLPYLSLWQTEALSAHFSKPFALEFLEWGQYLQSLEEEEFYQFLGQGSLSHSDHPLLRLSQAFHDLSSLPKCYNNQPISKFFLDEHKFVLRRATKKKIGEVYALTNFILKQRNSAKHFYDLAAGVGHLVQCLCKTYNAKGTIVDYNPSFATKLNRRNPQQQINFFCHDLLSSKTLPRIDEQHWAETCLLTLHGCGDLLDQSLNFFTQYSFDSIFAVGCCYHLKKMSLCFKQHSVTLSNQALLLAARSLERTNHLAWQQRLQFKHFRYAWEFWYQEYQGCSSPPLRSSPKVLYQGDFIDYAKVQAQRCGLVLSSHDQRNLKLIFEDEMKQQIRKDLIYMGAVRSIFARTLEVYIALRRAERLKNVGLETEVAEIFDPALSPRNILIYSKK